MKKTISIILCLCVFLTLAGCGADPVEYVAPTDTETALRGSITENTYTSAWLDLAVKLPENMAFADTATYNLAHRQSDPASNQFCEFYAASVDNSTTLKMVLTVEKQADITDMSQWLKDQSRMPEQAAVSAVTLLEKEYLCLTVPGQLTHWQLYRQQDDHLICLQLWACEKEYTLEQLSALFYPAEGMPVINLVEPTLKTISFADKMGNGNLWRTGYGDVTDFQFKEDGTITIIGGVWVGGYGETTHKGSGTYQVYGNLVYIKYRIEPVSFEGMPPSGPVINHESYALYNPVDNTLTDVTGSNAGRTRTFYER